MVSSWFLGGFLVVAGWLLGGIYIGATVFLLVTWYFLFVPWYLCWCHGIFVDAMIFLLVPWYFYWYHGIFIGALVFLLVPYCLPGWLLCSCYWVTWLLLGGY